MTAARWYRVLLVLFPAPIRTRHGDDMAQLFADRCREAGTGVSWPRRSVRLAGLWLAAIRDAIQHGLLARTSPGRRNKPVPEAPAGSPVPPDREPPGASLLYDLRLAARGLRASPGFTAVALTSLALGIGAGTAIFTLINVVVLRPLPVETPERLVQVSAPGGSFETTRLTNPMWEAVRDREEIFDGAFAFTDTYFRVGDPLGADRRLGAWVSGESFSTLGLSPAAGRLFGPADDQRGCTGLAVLGHGYWQQTYGGNPDAVGDGIILNGKSFEIIGVAPQGFGGMTLEWVTDIYVPLCAEAYVYGDRSSLDARRTWNFRAVGRMRPGDSLQDVATALAALTPAVLADSVPLDWETNRQDQFMQRRLVATPAATGFSGVREQYRRSLFVLLAAVGVVLLVVCTNLANLSLARTARRRREIAMRVALGARRTRLLQQFLVESLLLAGIGAAAGVALAHRAGAFLVALITPTGSTYALDLTPDLRVLLFVSTVAAGTGVLFGVAPAIHASRVQPHDAMKGSPGGAGLRPAWLLGGGLVAAQVTLSMVLLSGMGLLAGTFWHLETLDPGFARDRVLVVEVDIRRAELTDEQRRATFLSLRRALEDLPEVDAASFAEVTPVSGNWVTEHTIAEGFRSLLDEDVEVFTHRVGPGYFASMGAPVLRGRDFDDGDTDGAEPVAIVSESMARRVFGTVDVVGRRFHRRLTDNEVSGLFQVVGVVRDAKYRSLRDESVATVYFASPQQPVRWWGSQLAFHVVAAPGTGDVSEALQNAIERNTPRSEVEIRPLSAVLSASLSRERLLALISVFFGGLALFLAVIGLYGVMAFNVSRRVREIGVRLALGASREGVFGLVLRQAARPVSVGVVAGVLGGLAAARTLESLLYGVSASDPRVFAATAAVLVLAAVTSAALPARRAATTDPAVVLRQDAD